MKKKLKVIAIIPARMGSSRFPGKPLENILGIPMIEHVRRRVENVSILDEVYVATCDEEIKKIVEAHGGKAIMTSDQHERCTDRIEEAARNLHADVVVNVQGDEPMVSARSIEEVVAPFFSMDDVYATCLVYPIVDRSELTSKNIVKSVISKSERILYLSRAAIPGNEEDKNTQYYKQSGIMAFKKEFLHQFNDLESTPLEKKESVDMMRILENDFWIQGVVSLEETKGVDIPSQIQMIENEILGSPEQKALFEKVVQR